MLLLHQLQILPDVSTYTTGAGHHQSLNLMVINIQSVTSKKESFLECINYYNPDIILGCETWLSEMILNSEILSSSSYTVFRNDRNDSYGGVLIGVKSNLESVIAHPS